MKELINQNLDVKNLKEHDSVFLHNPTKEDFEWKFNGEFYRIKAGDIKSFSKFVSFHLAKHLSTKMIEDEAYMGIPKKDLADIKAPIHSKISQLNVYDTTERRIALFKILQNEDLVSQVILTYPFKGFVGEMKFYEDFVKKFRGIKEENQDESKESNNL